MPVIEESKSHRVMERWVMGSGSLWHVTSDYYRAGKGRKKLSRKYAQRVWTENSFAINTCSGDWWVRKASDLLEEQNNPQIIRMGSQHSISLWAPSSSRYQPGHGTYMMPQYPSFLAVLGMMTLLILGTSKQLHSKAKLVKYELRCVSRNGSLLYLVSTQARDRIIYSDLPKLIFCSVVCKLLNNEWDWNGSFCMITTLTHYFYYISLALLILARAASQTLGFGRDLWGTFG